MRFEVLSRDDCFPGTAEVAENDVFVVSSTMLYAAGSQKTGRENVLSG